MSGDIPDLVFIGFGEAAMAFAEGLAGTAAGYDIRIGQQDKQADFVRCGVKPAATNAEAVTGAPLILSLVTADQALAAARETAAAISPGALYCDLNSVAPQTKLAAREAVERAGARYADVAVMAPVLPARRAVPLLVSGPHAEAAVAALERLDFAPRIIAGDVGAATSVKMIRSVIIKGIEALSAECFTAAAAAGVIDEVVASLDASWPSADWFARADYNLGRMIVHGPRRAAELDEVARTLDALDVEPVMTRAAARCQRAIGELALTPPEGLPAKTQAILNRVSVPA